MTQSQTTQYAREALTETIIDAKTRKNLTFEAINEGTEYGICLEQASSHAPPLRALTREYEGNALIGRTAADDNRGRIFPRRD